MRILYLTLACVILVMRVISSCGWHQFRYSGAEYNRRRTAQCQQYDACNSVTYEDLSSCNKLKLTKAVSTLRSSLGVPHPSTNRAFHCLTSEFKWDPVYSVEYGRQQTIEPHSLSYDILTQQEVVYSRGLRVIH